MSCRDLATWQGTRLVVPAMAARRHAQQYHDLSTHEDYSTIKITQCRAIHNIKYVQITPRPINIWRLLHGQVFSQVYLWPQVGDYGANWWWMPDVADSGRSCSWHPREERIVFQDLTQDTRSYDFQNTRQARITVRCLPGVSFKHGQF